MSNQDKINSCKSCKYYVDVKEFPYVLFWLGQTCGNATRRHPKRFKFGYFMLRDSSGWLLLPKHKYTNCKFYEK